METFSFEVNKELWEEEVFPKVKEIFLKGGKEAFLIVKQCLLDLIRLAEEYYDPLIVLKGFAGTIIDKMNLDSRAVGMFLGYIKNEIANLNWKEVIK